MPLSNTLPAHVTADFVGSKELLERHDMAVPQLYEHHAEHNPNYPVFVYHDGERVQYINYATTNHAIDRAARYIGSQVGVNNKHAGIDKPVVGVLANAGEENIHGALKRLKPCRFRLDHLCMHHDRGHPCGLHRLPDIDA